MYSKNWNYKTSSHQRQASILYDQLGLLPTVERHNVPLCLREDGVQKGYRPINQKWHYYLRSALQFHNETVNIWTHFLGAVLVILQLVLYYCYGDVDFLNDPYAWPFLSGGFCCITMYLSSSLAHTFQSKSDVCHYFFFMMDYLGIGVGGVGCVMLHFHYFTECNFYNAVKSWFVPVGTALGYSICMCCTYAKLQYHRPYPWQRKVLFMVPMTLASLLSFSPNMHTFYSCYYYNHGCTDAMPFQISQMLTLLISAFFYASELPQKMLPLGACDYILHSHHFFHVAATSTTLLQIKAVYLEFNQRSEILRLRPAPTLITSFGPVLLVLFLNIATIISFQRKLHEKVLVQKKLEEDMKNR